MATLSLTDVFPECVDAHTECSKQMKNINIKTLIVRKHALHTPICVFKLSENHPFICLFCWMRNPFSHCPHVERVSLDFPLHPEPVEIPESEDDAEWLLNTMAKLEKELMTPLDRYIEMFYQEVYYFRGLGFEPEECHEVVTKEQKKLLDLEKEIWENMAATFNRRNSDRYVFLQLFKNKTYYDKMVENTVAVTKRYNAHVRQCIEEAQKREEEKDTMPALEETQEEEPYFPSPVESDTDEGDSVSTQVQEDDLEAMIGPY